MVDVVCAGHICVDITPSFPDRGMALSDIFIGGKQVDVGRMEMSTGGSASNTGAALNRLGLKTPIMGRIGDDMLGKLIAPLLQELGAYSQHLSVAEGEGSSYTVAVAVPGCDRVFLHAPAVNDTFTSADIDFDVVADAKIFHFGYAPLMRETYINGGAELLKIMKTAKELGVTTSMDTAFPDPTSFAANQDWNAIFEKTMPYTDIFVPSVEELVLLSERPLYDKLAAMEGGVINNVDLETVERIADRMIGFGAKIVMVKCSTKGMYLRTAGAEALAKMGPGAPKDVAAWADKRLYTGIYTVENMKSSTGAGDCSIAGMLAALLNGIAPEQALNMAIAAGAYCVTEIGAAAGIVAFDEMAAKVAGGWKKREPGMERPGFSYMEEYDIYSK